MATTTSPHTTRPTPIARHVADALAGYDTLPDDARVRLPVVVAVTGYSPATVWRRVLSGRLPQPHRDGRITSWRVGDLRAAMTVAA